MADRKPLLIDTFPLVELMFYRCIEEFRWQFLKEKIMILNTKEVFQKFRKFLKGYHLYTTSGVIAELQRHQREAKVSPREFWKLFLQEMKNIPITEIYINIEVTPHNVIEIFGPVDASLFAIAKNKKMYILLKDKKFSDHCQKNGIKVINFEDLKWG